MENEQRTYGIAEWAAALRARRTEEELAEIATWAREREAARSSSPQEPEFHPKLQAALVPEAEWGERRTGADLEPTA